MMEKLKISALLLAATIVAPNCVAFAPEHAPVKHVEEFSTDELRDTLRALNLYVYESEPIKEIDDEQLKQHR